MRAMFFDTVLCTMEALSVAVLPKEAMGIIYSEEVPAPFRASIVLDVARFHPKGKELLSWWDKEHKAPLSRRSAAEVAALSFLMRE